MLDLAIPALLFPAISLLYLSYNGRFLALAQLVRKLHKEWVNNHDKTILAQIHNLRDRLRLIRWMQIFGASSFIMSAVSMSVIFLGYDVLGKIFFGAALLLLLASVGTLLRENAISVKALELQLKEVDGSK